MLGKPGKDVKGLLGMSLDYLLAHKSVKQIELSAVEAYGTHVSRVFLFDLFNEHNQNTDWGAKKGSVSLNCTKLTTVPISETSESETHIRVEY